MNSFQNYSSYHPINKTNENPTHEYLDCEIINNSTTNLSPIPVVFSQVKTSQIIDNCSDYYLSVVRWSLDSGLPQIIPQMALSSSGGTDINRTAYVVNIAVEGVIGDGGNPITDYMTSKTVIFEPEDLTVPVPQNQPINPDEVYNNPYYYIHSIGNFLDMVNKAIKECYDELVIESNAFPLVIPPALLPVAPPHFDWNGSEISASVSVGWIKKNTLTPPVGGVPTQLNFYLTFNTPLHNLFDTFPFRFLNSSTAASLDGINYSMIFHNHQWESTYSTDNPLVEYYVFNQEGSSVPSWSPVTSIVFQTATIPVNPSKTGAPTYLGESLKNTLQQSGISNVLTDFQIPLDRGDEYTNSILYYVPSSEYRLFDLISNGGLLNLNISIFWKDKLGFIHPFLLKNGSGGSLKMLLRKKTFNGI
jgi:hypothetical protein